MSEVWKTMERVRSRYLQKITLSLVDVNTTSSELPCIDPKSLAMYAYMMMAKKVHSLSFDCPNSGARDISRFPQLSIGEDTFYSVKELSTTKYSFEKQTIPLGDTELLNIERAINDLEDVVLYGLKSCTKSSVWDSRIRAITAEASETDLEDMMKMSFEFLSELLKDKAYILDTVYGGLDGPSYLDAMLF